MNREPQPTKDPTQPSLLDEELAPVPFTLTARARRVVAPESLPSLAIVTTSDGVDPKDDGEQEADDTADPRRARARALRRAGVTIEVIATELGVEAERAIRWTDDVTPAKPAQRRQEVSLRRRDQEAPAAYVSGRAAARAAWKRGTAVSHGAAMAAGFAEVTPFAVRLRGELAVVAGILQWLRDATGVQDTVVRAQVAAAPGAALDEVAHRVAQRLRLPVEEIATRPWADAPDADAVEVAVRIADPHLAGTIAGWREGLLAELLADPGLLEEVTAAAV